MTRFSSRALVGAALTVLLGSFAVIPANAEPVAPVVVTWTTEITNNASFLYGKVPAAPTCSTTALDELNQPLTCTVDGYLTTVGTHTLTPLVGAAPGVAATPTITYTVKTTLKGFYGPVRENGRWNSRKAGSTVPFKFKIADADGVKAKSTAAVASFVATPIPCKFGDPVVGGVIDLLSITNHGQALKFHKSDGAFHKNWKTPKAAKAVKVKGKKLPVAHSCYQVTMTAADGQSLTALFDLK